MYISGYIFIILVNSSYISKAKETSITKDGCCCKSTRKKE